MFLRGMLSGCDNSEPGVYKKPRFTQDWGYVEHLEIASVPHARVALAQELGATALASLQFEDSQPPRAAPSETPSNTRSQPEPKKEFA